MKIRSLFVTTRAAKLQRLTVLRDRFAFVPEEQFRYDLYVSRYDAKDKCGTICCIAGWLPAIFPTVFKWLQVGTGFIVKIHGWPTKSFTSQIRRFFGLNKNTYSYLFEGKALMSREGKVLRPAVKNIRSTSKLVALGRIDQVIQLIEDEVI
jgi:hypothetical protein